MQQSVQQRSVTAPAVVGVTLMLVGGAILVARAAGFDIAGSIGEWGWPFFVIIPGLALLVLSLVPQRPTGVGLATAGAIVTMVGSLLLYQSRTGHWESWSYAWALLPLAAGLALLGYGLFAADGSLIRRGAWMAAIAGAIFVAGAWYFEQLFAGELRALDASDWWPVVLIGIGGLIALRAFTSRGTETPPAPRAPAAPTMGSGPTILPPTATLRG